MKARACDRLWQAAAMQDGRLPSIDVASFERHIRTCDECRREVEALSDLRDATERLPILTSTPLERRRLRNEILRRADAITTSSSRASRIAWLRVAALLVVVAAAVALWLRTEAVTLWSSPPMSGQGFNGTAAASVPTFRITASPGSAWNIHESGPTLRLSVTKGRTELEVDTLRRGQRFLVDLPDGELEVQGTRFVIDADGARTLGVRVLEGRVALRIEHRAPQVLQAGDQFSAGSVASAAPSSAASGSRAAGEPNTPLSRTSATALSPAPASPPTPGLPTTDADLGRGAPSRDASDFATAVSAFSAGDYGRAEQLFSQFEIKHPLDTRVEDAVFLRAVARARRGDATGAKSAAREYLRRYPHGLRRQDAERLVR